GSDGSQSGVAGDISSGDGGYAFFTDSHIFVSRQEGSVIRHNTNVSGSPSGFALVHPAGAENQFFIHPYALDPNNESIMYYPADNAIWRNLQVSSIDNDDDEGATAGWEELTNVNAPQGYVITALSVSLNPTNVLYYGAYSATGV